MLVKEQEEEVPSQWGDRTQRLSETGRSAVFDMSKVSVGSAPTTEGTPEEASLMPEEVGGHGAHMDSNEIEHDHTAHHESDGEGSSAEDHTAVVNEDLSHFESFLYEKVEGRGADLDTTQHSLATVADLEGDDAEVVHIRRSGSFSSERSVPVVDRSDTLLASKASRVQLLPVQPQSKFGGFGASSCGAATPTMPKGSSLRLHSTQPSPTPSTPKMVKEKSFFSGKYLSWVPWGKGTSGKEEKRGPGYSEYCTEPAQRANPIDTLSLPAKDLSLASADLTRKASTTAPLDDPPPPLKRKWCCLG